MKKLCVLLGLCCFLSGCLSGGGSPASNNVTPPKQAPLPETEAETETEVKTLPTLPALSSAALISFDTGLTINKVRSAKTVNGQYILASSYEGTLVALDYNGVELWRNKLSGLLNNDIWSEDIDNDGTDEIFIANADGSTYALNAFGEILWQFKASATPMYSVSVIWDTQTPYVVCGGYDMNLYYLNIDGSIAKTIASTSYSQEKSFGNAEEHKLPDNYKHITNFIRPIKKADGSQILAVVGTNNSMQTSGSMYLFEPFADLPSSKTKLTIGKAVGDLKVVDIDNDGNEEIIMGNSSAHSDAKVFQFNISDQSSTSLKINTIKNAIDFGYRVIQPELITQNNEARYFVLYGERVLLMDTAMSVESAEVLANKYSFNDMWKIPQSNTILLASAQSGGSAIHLINTNHNNWKTAFTNLTPPGKIEKILATTNKIKTDLSNYTPSNNLNNNRTVYLLTESQKNTFTKNKIAELKVSSPINPIFLNNIFMPKVEDWDRSILNNEPYENKRDGRKSYSLTQQEVLDKVSPLYSDDSPGAAFWGGHGNDPYFFSLDTHKKTFDLANGKKTILIYPELEKKDESFAKVMDHLFYPLADYGKVNNGQISIRTKHLFWQSNIYLPMWSKLIAGDYAGQFVPSMEETTDKSMELSVAARVGVWTSGSVNEWGTRFARDVPSFDRMRQHSHQMLPNFAMRHLIYHISNGATQLNNFAVDQEYMSLLWDLIAKGVLFAPKPEQLIHLSPVHISMLAPDERYLEEGSNVKWLTFYNSQEETENPMVYSRLNGSWPGAKITEWDFSRYAAGVNERRLNSLPPYPSGLVMMTPPQSHAGTQTRGLLKDHLHPIYKNILKEYFSDGYSYYSEDESQKYPADTYYQTIKADIENSAALLPITVTGNVAWTVAQTAPKTLRLTLIDGGYLNPNEQTATVTFNTVSPNNVQDVLDKSTFMVSDNKTTIIVPTGGFRFIDITLTEALK